MDLNEYRKKAKAIGSKVRTRKIRSLDMVRVGLALGDTGAWTDEGNVWSKEIMERYADVFALRREMEDDKELKAQRILA